MLVDYIHTGVFVPRLNAPSGHKSSFSFAASHDPSLLLEYRDPKAYASELAVANSELNSSALAFDQTDVSTEDRSNAKIDGDDSAEHEANPHLKRRKAPRAALDKFAYWSRKNAEVHGGSEEKESICGDHDHIANPTRSLKARESTINTRHASQSSAAAPPRSFVDRSSDDPVCYLCNTKLSNGEVVRRHEKESKLHLSNLEDAAKCAAASVKLAEKVPKIFHSSAEVIMQEGKHKADSISLETAGRNGHPRGSGPISSSEYKDRAAERRSLHSQPKNVPFKSFSMPHDATDVKRELPFSANEVSSSPPERSSSKQLSKASAMMASMGYAVGGGGGLGAHGSGVTDPIAPNIYAGGVGLGAEGAVLGDAAVVAASKTKGDKDWKGQRGTMDEKTRARYERLG